MIYISPNGGLCNRLKVIASSIEYAKKNQVEITILWSIIRSLNASLLDFFEMPKNNAFILKEEISYLHFIRIFFLRRSVKHYISQRSLSNVFHEIHKKHAKAPLREIEMYMNDQLKLLINPILEASRSSSLIESFTHLGYPASNYDIFVPLAHIQKKINLTVKNFNNTIGLHIRRTDHINAIKHSTDKKFIDIINKTLQKEPNATFFLSTDSPETKEYFQSKFKDKIITNYYPSYLRNNKQALIDAVVDLYCLSKTKKLYGSYISTFSQVAADIGAIKEVSVM